MDASRKLEAFQEMDTCFNPTSQDFQLAQGVLTAAMDANVAGFMDCMSVVARVARDAWACWYFIFHFFFFLPCPCRKAFGEHRLVPWHMKTLLAVKGIIEHGDLC